MFCAPNKVYEYAGFGMPMLANDIPGLRARVAYSGAGVCFDRDDPREILSRLDFILAHYEELSANAVKYFEADDISAATDKILCAYREIVLQKNPESEKGR